MNLLDIYLAGNVRRYHSNADMARLGQTNADHQGRCVQLLLALHPKPSVALIWAVAYHDLGERWVGDLPGPFKQAHPELAAQHAEVEADYAGLAMGLRVLDDLSREDLRWLKLVDRLEAYAFMMTHAPQERHGGGWPELRASLYPLFSALPVQGQEWRLKAFLNALDERARR
jgi:5'-deoxynucleotidase